MFRRKVLTTLICAVAVPNTTMANTVPQERPIEQHQVRSFHLFGHTNGWNVVDRDEVIVWASPSKAYLLRLRYPRHDLHFAIPIGISSSAGNVSSDFDNVIVDEWRYLIETIYKPDRTSAKELLSCANRNS